MDRSYARRSSHEAARAETTGPSPGRRSLTGSLPPRGGEDDFDPTAALQMSAAAGGPPPNLGPVLDEALGFFPVETAQAGVAGASAPLPHLDTIQASFGRHDVRGVRAEVGGAAGEAASALGAQAYATGDAVGFRSAPDLHTAAHEAAHVVQQRQGVALKGGVGAAGDPYEQHADRVADAVVRGESAEALLDEHAGGGGGGVAVQRLEVGGGKDLGDGKGAGAGVTVGDGGVALKGEYTIAPELAAIPLVPGILEAKPVFETVIALEGGGKNLTGDGPATATGKASVTMTGAIQIHAGKDAAFSVFGEGAIQFATSLSGEYTGGELKLEPLTAELVSQVSIGVQVGGYSIKVPVDTYQLLLLKGPTFTLTSGKLKETGGWEFDLGKDVDRFVTDVLLCAFGGPAWYGLKKASEWVERSWEDVESLFGGDRVADTVARVAEFHEFWNKHSEKYREMLANPATKKYLSQETVEEIQEVWYEAIVGGSITAPVQVLNAKRMEAAILERIRGQVKRDLVAEGYDETKIDAMIANIGE